MGEARSAPTVGQMVLGMRLRDLREKAGVSYDQAARALHVNQTTVRRMEKAEVGLKLPYVEKLLQTYGADQEEIDSFLALAEEANRPGWWHRFRDVLPDWFSLYVSLEGAASRIRAYEPHFIPGLLQTEEYARTLLSIGFPNGSDRELDRRVALRMERQELLNRPDGPHLWVVMDETVLRLSIGSPQVMRAQIDHLIEAVQKPNVTLQVVPFSAGPHPGMGGPFQLFRFKIPELPDIVYAEGLTGAGYLDQRSDVVAYLEALDRMGTQATPARRTESFLRGIRKEL
ncbi:MULTISPECIES: helix-turn-helix domain-containing protein [Streptomyces]|uniref:Transcriptional regulator with XRE-family HTH domain n=2 Tax=Streptomyces TaxID=1883 RepID=A0ABT9L3K5_9ACTN|nr:MULTISPECIES: helix-turn-helix transcriptional regulator [Streptomyces]MBW8086841.1 helix-turn-helix domain-containing protein [Streptomyces hygroscopicus subsp. hygroscopicus]MCO8307590.1 helix-turn-helix domain-containing protein [Streptomyces sp. RKCA744]MDN3053988.1 helix-turn-helix transcriptional regulator [Streptomyces sp. SRF1]MDP9615294.1 transcriptional regulator with XRE-family HTH domain [Streptomyces demainii]GHJ33196.1 transcriptional regulator [Streptomyces hygroscopicus]